MAIIATIVDGQIVSIQTHCSPAQVKGSDKVLVPLNLTQKSLLELKYVDGQIVEKTPQEKFQMLLIRRWMAIRAVRDFKLQQTDFEAFKAFEGVPSANWPQIKEHRQMLRDIPQVYANDIAAAEAVLGIGAFQ